MVIPKDLVLETDKVILKPLDKTDHDDFLRLAQQDYDMWEYFTLNLGDPASLKQWIEMAYADRDAGTRRPMTIIDKASGKITGSSSIGNIAYQDLRFEIGWSWVGKDFRSTGINKHAKFAMMNYAFEILHFERVEFKTDVLNARARKGLENIGGIEEGILRSHMTMWNDRRRTSIYYSVLKNEWKEVKATIFKDIQAG